MSIQELFSKFKGIFHNQEYQLSVLIVLVAFGSFALGRASDSPLMPIEALTSTQNATIQNEATAVTHDAIESDREEQEANTNVAGGYVASKNGTKYHLPWCPGAKQIKEENKLFFATKDEAEKSGYTPAANCKGI